MDFTRLAAQTSALLVSICLSTRLVGADTDPVLAFFRGKYSDIENRVAIPADAAEIAKQLIGADKNETAACLGIAAEFRFRTMGDLRGAAGMLQQCLVTMPDPKAKNALPDWHLGLPAPASWRVDRNGCLAALSLVRMLIHADEPAKALEVLDTYKPTLRSGQDYPGIVACLYGDWFVKGKQFARAVEHYEIAESLLSDQLKDYGTASYSVNFHLDHARREITYARHMQEIEEYGPAWVAYRDADRARIIEKDYPEAYRLYQIVIRDFPGTVYADAAEAYSIRSLFLFSTDDCTEASKKKLSELLGHLALLRKALDSLISAKVGPGSLAEQRMLLDEQKTIMDALQKFPPTGAKAASEAMSRAKRFLDANRNGMYRGEVMEHVGDWFFEERFDIAQANRFYQDAIDWYTNIVVFDKEMSANAIEQRVKAVAAPPGSMRKSDAWGNSAFEEIVPGQLVNHRTCTWYLPFHRMMSTLKHGMCQFVLGDIGRAMASTQIVLEVDELEAQRAAQGMPNACYRLRDDYRENRMFATKEELNEFTGQARNELLVAEFYYEIENYPRASTLYDGLLKKFGHTLNTGASTYLEMQRVHCQLVLGGDRKNALDRLWAISANVPNTPSWPRVHIELANLIQNEKGGLDRAIVLLDAVIKRKSGTKYAFEAVWCKARYLYYGGRKEEGMMYLTMLQTRAKGTFYALECAGFIELVSRNNEQK